MSAYYNCLISYDLNMGIYPITGPCFLSVIWQTIRIELMHMQPFCEGDHFNRAPPPPTRSESLDPICIGG